ncbi:UNVERIFIED_CONTAM: hypothetical protein GTU68_009098 [Idotea baltica]|nr:hypothetical protein [Idotea baltica]
MNQNEERNISRLTKQTVALILAGGQGSRLHELTDWRAKPAVPFGGKFRIIDFALSNCINSGIRRVGVVTQYKSHSLVRHIIRGWSGFKPEFGEFVEVLPASKRVDEQWYKGTVDAVFQNLDILRRQQPEFVLVLGGDHIYKMDYGPLVSSHVNEQADMTVCCIEVAAEEAAGAFGVITVDDNNRVLAFDEKPAVPAEIPGKPGRVDFLYEQIVKDADDPKSSHDFGSDLLPDIVNKYRVYAYPMGEGDGRTYWRDVGTLDAFWSANMELLEFEPELDLYDKEWPIYTHQEQLPPAKFIHDDEDRRGMAINCCVSGGCIVSGANIKNSVLFSNVNTRSFSSIEDSVLLPDVVIHRHCKIRKAIIDVGCVIPENMEIGYDAKKDKAAGFRVTENGITLVTPDHLGQTLHRIR